MIIEKRGIRVGILGYTDNEPTWKAEAQKPGIHYIQVGDKEFVQKEISSLRDKVDVLIITIHWGPNMQARPTESFRTFAHFMIDRGVDIIHGHSAHIFQGMEQYKKGLILYDTGDFIDDYYIDPILRNDQSFFFLVEISKKGIQSVRLIPSVIRNFAATKAKGAEKKEIEERMKFLSENLH